MELAVRTGDKGGQRVALRLPGHPLHLMARFLMIIVTLSTLEKLLKVIFVMVAIVVVMVSSL